jgi:galactonate dehydratase
VPSSLTDKDDGHAARPDVAEAGTAVGRTWDSEGSDASVKIVDVQTLICHARMRNWVFVKVVTDQPGLIGWGEATLEFNTHAVVGAIEDLKELLLGQDPTRVEYLWQVMYRQAFWHGNSIVRGTAQSGIDLALWDILGKIHGVPCHRLWGGPVRDFVRLYAHLGGGRLEDFYQTSPADVARFAELAQAAVEDGFTAFKAMAVGPAAPIDSRRVVRNAEACVQAMREAVGGDVDIMVDCHARLSPSMGLAVARALDPYGLYFLEEPCWPEALDGLAAIAASVTTPIATGERLVSVFQFRELLERRACAVIQPDLTHCGGVTEGRRIGALAEAHRVAIAPHNPQGPISTAAAIEFGFASPSYVICEAVHNDVPWRSEVVHSAHETDIRTRTVRPSSAPGWGVDINEKEVARHPYEPDLLQRVFLPDGSVADW